MIRYWLLVTGTCCLSRVAARHDATAGGGIPRSGARNGLLCLSIDHRIVSSFLASATIAIFRRVVKKGSPANLTGRQKGVTLQFDRRPMMRSEPQFVKKGSPDILTKSYDAVRTAGDSLTPPPRDNTGYRTDRVAVGSRRKTRVATSPAATTLTCIPGRRAASRNRVPSPGV